MMKGLKRKVLIVEDDFILYQQLASFFNSRGYEVIGNENGSAVDNYDDAVSLLRSDDPDIAILDITIKGKRDGLHLAAYIKEHFNSLVIILTGSSNDGNLERASHIAVDDFFLKVDKPVNKDQLWASIVIRLPKIDSLRLRKTEGDFFKVKEVDTSLFQLKGSSGKKGPEHDPLDLETFIRWEDILYITSYNSKIAGEGNNNILIQMIRDNKGFVNRSTMTEIYQMLPEYFARFNQSAILNLHCIEAKRKGTLYFIGKETFVLSDSYRVSAMERMKRVLGAAF